MDEFSKVHDKFGLLIRSAKKGDRRALKMAGRAVQKMKEIVKTEYNYTRIGPKVLRKSYEYFMWEENQIRSKKKMYNT